MQGPVQPEVAADRGRRHHWHPIARWLMGPKAFTASITRRERRRRQRSGDTVVQTRFVVSFRDPRTGRRKQLFFERQKDAAAMRDALVASVVTGTYAETQTGLTVAEVVEHWLENRRGEVKGSTWDSYRQAAGYIVGPLLVGTKLERHIFARKGVRPEGARLVEMLGSRPVVDLTTADIRSWHKTLTAQVSAYTANVAKKHLRAALALAAEDFHLRVPPMPTMQGRGRTRPKKAILTPQQVGLLLDAALADGHKGIYYAFPFLTGVRPSEQLALLWEDVDIGAGSIRIRRMQERDGSITDLTKTAAGTREIPISPLLASMLERWQHACPRKAGEPARVFPALGAMDAAEHKKRGGPLSYTNFRNNYWRPALAAVGLPYVTPHSARHAFISTLQAKGIEVGLVALLAGHANASVTLGHYTQAVRGGEAALLALEEAYGERRPERSAAPAAAGAAAEKSPIGAR
jgi:integrase